MGKGEVGTVQKEKLNEDVSHIMPTTSGAHKVATTERVAILETKPAETHAPRRVKISAPKINDENTNQAIAVVETKEWKKRSAGMGSAGKVRREEGRAAEAMRKMR